MRGGEEMSEDEEGEWIAMVAENAQKKLKSIPGLLLHKVIEVRIGPREVEERPHKQSIDSPERRKDDA